MPGKIPSPTPVFHMTHISNLPNILGGGLQPVALLQQAGTGYTNIAYNSIQQQRATKQVPCGPGGCLHDYVPFYFTQRSPMLYTISRGNVPCDGGQDRIIHLVTTAQQIAAHGFDFVFTDGHGIMGYTEFFDDLDNLSAVDWNTIAATYWHDTADDGDRKRRKQAEFLVHGVMPWSEVTHIYVKDEAIGDEVAGLMAATQHKPKMLIRPQWYY